MSVNDRVMLESPLAYTALALPKLNPAAPPDAVVISVRANPPGRLAGNNDLRSLGAMPLGGDSGLSLEDS